jgi:drug/metabolite transporter superfamily protein YnfA
MRSSEENHAAFLFLGVARLVEPKSRVRGMANVMNPTTGRVFEFGVLLLASMFEVTGDAIIRSGLRERGWPMVALGVATLGAYGVIVNLLAVDFSKMLAAYVGFFAVVSVIFGRAMFQETTPVSTWFGLLVILLGSTIVQFGSAR